LLGTFGDLAILSFGREKVISGLAGGALIVNDTSFIQETEKEISILKPLSKRNILKEMGNYFSWRLLFRRIYNNSWGANFIKFLYQFDLFNVVTSKKELDGLKPDWYPSKMANIFAEIVLSEFSKIEEYNEKRERVAEVYFKKIHNNSFKLLPKHDGVYLRVVALHPKAHLVLEKSKELKLNFGNWYNAVVYPESVHLAKLGYKSGSCPKAERVARETINLPNYLGMIDSEVERTISFINDFQ
jgi:dTDP-4-amino-4,6-dideoxygalactose transaminase